MRRICLFALVLALLPTLVFAQVMQPGPQKRTLELDAYRPVPAPGTELPAYNAPKVPPAYTFTKVPTAIITNYYDYMIGSYNEIPLQVIPQSAGGGYFMTYHGRRQATSTRRVFYSYLDPAGNVINNNEITSVQNHEGFPAMAVDPVDAKPLYAWHANADADANLETQFTSDAFIAGIAGLFNDISLACDAPVTITPPTGSATTDNEFIWPAMVIGPSPVAGKRRVYIAMRNYVSHAVSGNPIENIYIAYTDFNGLDIEMATPLVWSHISIPEQDAWNHDMVEGRRPSGTIAVDDAGNLYYAGNHFAYDAESVGIVEADMDVFVCPNYGQGTWTRVSAFSNLPSWNPPGQPGGTGYFVDAEIPVPDADLTWAIVNSSHMNAVFDNEGKIHVPSTWGLSAGGGYWPDYQLVKEFVFDPVTQAFEVHEIYPQKNGADTFNQWFVPWDMEAPWGEAEYFLADDGQYYLTIAQAGGGHPGKTWPYPHWDETAHTDLMFFHYGGIKISEANDQGMMVAIWQDSQRAVWINRDAATDFTSYTNTPEIMISVSPDNGNIWSEPIRLNNVETPQMSGIKPMYTYPADKVIYVSTDDTGHKVGKIGVMFYNDFTWGSNVNTPAYHPTPDGGEVMFMELQVTFPIGQADGDNHIPAVGNLLLQNYPNPFNPETTISFDLPESGPANLSVYNLKGQLVRTLVNSGLGFGRHSVVWNGTDDNGQSVSSGLYYYRLTTPGHSESRKMMLMK